MNIYENQKKNNNKKIKHLWTSNFSYIFIGFQTFCDTIRVAKLEQTLRRHDVDEHVCDVLVGMAQESRVRVGICGCTS